MNSTPRIEQRPCWACTFFEGFTAQGTAALCGRRGTSKVVAGPDRGCAFWEREVGTDDEPVHPEFRGSTPWTVADATRQPVMPPQPVAWAP